MEAPWKCSQCGEEFTDQPHRLTMCRIHGRWRTVCTHHPEAISQADIVLSGLECIGAYSVNHADQGLLIAEEMLAHNLLNMRLKAADKHSRN
jgi:hypothetical protein